jgi:hypothetical protein
VGERSRRLEIRKNGKQWIAELEDEEPVISEDPWFIAIKTRLSMVAHAIRVANGFVPLHAAVVIREKDILLLSGPGGSGKTTLTLALLERGWSYSSDDLAPIQIDTHEIIPFPKPIGVKDSDRWSELSLLWSPEPWLPPPSGAFLVPPSIATRIQRDPMQATHLVLLEFEEGVQSTLEEVTSARAVTCCGSQMESPTSQALMELTRLCQSVVRRRLFYGSLDEGLSLILGLVDNSVNLV